MSLNIKGAIIGVIITALLGSYLPVAQGDELNLPAPGVMVHLSTQADLPILKGIKIYPEKPFLFDFILAQGSTKKTSSELKQESIKLIKYFLASLTIPEDDQWVNLSPYEKNRITPTDLGETQLGQNLLAQDYLLKQLTASLIYPQDSLGKEFWNKVYNQAFKAYGTTQIPVKTFNKVWIVADKAKIYVHDQTAFVVAAHLKVMLEEDYLALSHHAVSRPISHLGSDIVRQIVLPQIEKEVNEGHNFAPLRQVFYSMVLATWYKRYLKEAVLNQGYANKDKLKGLISSDKDGKEKIYQQYLQAYKKGVFNFIKEDVAPDGETVVHKYFSGGVSHLNIAQVVPRNDLDVAMFAEHPPDGLLLVRAQMNKDTAMQARVLLDINKPVLMQVNSFVGTKIHPKKVGQKVYMDKQTASDYAFDFISQMVLTQKEPSQRLKNAVEKYGLTNVIKALRDFFIKSWQDRGLNIDSRMSNQEILNSVLAEMEPRKDNRIENYFNYLKDRPIVVTGSTGSLATPFVYETLKQYQSRIILFQRSFRDSNEEKELKKASHTFLTFYGDLNDGKRVGAALRYFKQSDAHEEGVVHLGGLSLTSMDTPAEVFKNIIYTKNILEAMRDTKTQYLFFASSLRVHEIYSSPYAMAKYMEEKMIEKFCRKYNIKYVILRLPNVAGSFQMGDVITGDQNLRLIPTLENSFEHGEQFKLTSNPKTPIGFIDFEDVAELIKRGLTYLFMGGKSFVEDVYPKENYLLQQIVARAQGRPIETEKLGMTENPHFLENRLGWQPTKTFDDIWAQAHKLAGKEKKYRQPPEVDFKNEALAMQEVYAAMQDPDLPFDDEDRMECLLGLLIYSINSRTDLPANQKKFKDTIFKNFRRTLRGYDVDEKRDFIKLIVTHGILNDISRYEKDMDKEDVLYDQYGQYQKAIVHLWDQIRSRDGAMLTMNDEDIRRILTTRYSSDPVYLLFADMTGTLIDTDPSGGKGITFLPLDDKLKAILEKRAQAGAVTVIVTGDRFKDARESVLNRIDKRYWPQFIVSSQTGMIGYQFNAAEDRFDVLYDAKNSLDATQQAHWQDYRSNLINMARHVVENDLGDLLEKHVDAEDGTESWEYQKGKLIIRSHQLAIALNPEIKERRPRMMDEIMKKIEAQKTQLEADGFFNTSVVAAGDRYIDLPFIPGFDKEKGLDILKATGTIEKALQATGIAQNLGLDLKHLHGKGIMGLADSYRGNDRGLGHFIYKWGGINVSVGMDDFNHPHVNTSPSLILQQALPTGPAGSAYALSTESEMKLIFMSPGLRKQELSLQHLYYSDRYPRMAARSFSRLKDWVQSHVNKQTLMWNLLRMRQSHDKLIITSPVRLDDGTHRISDIPQIGEVSWKHVHDPNFRLPIITALISDSRKLYIKVTVENAPSHQAGKIVYVNKYFFEGENVTDANVSMEFDGPHRGRIPGGQKNVADLVAQLFDIKGIKITMELPQDPKAAHVILSGGLEASSIYLMSLLMACNKLTGANLTDGDLYALSLAISNGPVGDATGGQGHIAARYGNVIMSFVGGRVDAKGKKVAPYGVMVEPIWPQGSAIPDTLSLHIRRNQLRQPDENQRISREGELIKDLFAFMAKISIKDKKINRIFEGLNASEYQWTEGLRTGNVSEIIAAVTKGVYLRNQLTVIPINWAFDFWEDPHRLKPIELERAKLLNRDPHYVALKDLYDKYPNLRQVFRKGLYSYGMEDQMLKDAKRLGIGMYNGGAGGPESNVSLFAKNPKNYDVFMAKWGHYFKTEMFETNIGQGIARISWDLPMVELPLEEHVWLANELEKALTFYVFPLTPQRIAHTNEIFDINGELISRENILKHQGNVIILEYAQQPRIKTVFVSSVQVLTRSSEDQRNSIDPYKSFFLQRVVYYEGKEFIPGGKRYFDKETVGQFSQEFISLMQANPQEGTLMLEAGILQFGIKRMRKAIGEELVKVHREGFRNGISNQQIVEHAVYFLREADLVLRAGDYKDVFEQPSALVLESFKNVKDSKLIDSRDPLRFYLPIIVNKNVLTAPSEGKSFAQHAIMRLKTWGVNAFAVETTEKLDPLNTAFIQWESADMLDTLKLLQGMRITGVNQLVVVSSNNSIGEYLRLTLIEHFCSLNDIRYVILKRNTKVDDDKFAQAVARALVYLFSGHRQNVSLNIIPGDLFAFARLGWRDRYSGGSYETFLSYQSKQREIRSLTQFLQETRADISESNDENEKEEKRYIDEAIKWITAFKADHAVTANLPKTPGGIDLNGKHLQWDINQDNSLNGKGNTALNNIDFNGIEPLVLSITPLPRNYFANYFAT